LQKALKNIEGEIIVFDNASADGSKTFFENRFPGVRFIWNHENLGFGKANNEAFKFAGGDVILFLNPDTILPEDCLEKSLAFIHSQKEGCALGVRMVDGSGTFLKESKRSFPGPLTSFFKLSGLSFLFPKSKIFARYYLGNLPGNTSNEVDVLAGAFIMIPRKIFSAVSGFDEDFFMYGEDIDLSYRIQKAGFRNYYFAGTTILHFKGESTKKGSLNYVRMFYKAMSIFVKKHYGSSRARFYNLFIQSGIVARAGVSALARFLKWTGLPVMDALLIFLSFWLGKIFWNEVKPDIAFDNNLLWIAFPVFSLLFLTAAYYSGLYDDGYMQSRLNKSTVIAALVLFTVYAFLPLEFQFSRGVLLLSILVAYVLLTLTRLLFASMKIIQKKEQDLNAHIAIVGSVKEFEEVMQVISFLNKKDEVLGRIFINDPDKDSLGGLEDIAGLIRNGRLTNLIFCNGALSCKQIIGSVESLPRGIHSGIFTPGCKAIIESYDPKAAGEFYAATEYFRLSNPLYRRAKRLLDVGFAIFFLITFPVHLILKRRPGVFIRNCLKVLFGKRTFVGYGSSFGNLPVLRPGLITSTGQPLKKINLPVQAVEQSDFLYAKNYSVFTDFGLIRHNYQALS